jgi:L-alanine-DL-glutamate epimerase-like enolase superfamily enzyme
MQIQVIAYSVQKWMIRTRMPFKYGIATMTQLPHLFVRLECRIGGVGVTGFAADHLPPKWFTKEPEVPLEREISDMESSLGSALETSVELPAGTPFQLWWELYQALMVAPRFPPLLQHFGISLVERAVLDAVCRHAERPLWQLIRDNRLGIDLGAIDPELAAHTPSDFLPWTPLERVTLRHTVGLADYLRDAEIPSEERVSDGLPQSLEACIRAHGLREFKVKLSGDEPTDIHRLKDVERVVRAACGDDFQFSLDGNEQFTTASQLRGFGEAVYADPALAALFEHLLFIEQPVNRKSALAGGAFEGRRAWPRPVSIIIDESDGGLEDVPRALELGYGGVSHKNCKGVFKGIRNRCLLALRQGHDTEKRYCMTGEDLSNIGPIALTQDLAVQALLGNASVERNGHHYFRGLSMFPADTSSVMNRLHPDLYDVGPDGVAYLKVERGQLDLGSVNAAPFGTRFEAQWP